MQRGNIFETKQYVTTIDNNDYEDRLKQNIYLDYLTLDSYYKEGDENISLFVIYGKVDDNRFEELTNGEKLNDELFRYYDNYLNQINHIYINDSLISDLSWVMEKHLETGQLGIRTNINLKTFEKGKQYMDLEKLGSDLNGDKEYYFVERVIFEKL